MTLIPGARHGQSWLPLYPDDLHFSSGSWGRHSGVINSHVHVRAQTAGSAWQWLAQWLSRQGRSSVASCHEGGCWELQPRPRRWGEKGKLPPRWAVVTLLPQHRRNVKQCPLKERFLRKPPGQGTRGPGRPHRIALRYCILLCSPRDNKRSAGPAEAGPGSVIGNHRTELCWCVVSLIKCQVLKGARFKLAHSQGWQWGLQGQ